MSPETRDYSYSDLTRDATGSEATTYKLVVVPYGQYEVVLRFTDDDHFAGIEEIRVNKDFLSLSQKIARTGHLDVDEFYRE